MQIHEILTKLNMQGGVMGILVAVGGILTLGGVCYFLASLRGANRACSPRRLLRGQRDERCGLCEDLVQMSPHIFYSYDLVTNHFSFVSDGIAQVLGYGREMLLQQHRDVLRGLIHPDDRARFGEPALSVSTQHADEPISINRLRMRHHKGHWVPVVLRERVYRRNGQGQPLQMVGVVEELCTMQPDEDAAFQSEEMRRVILDSSFNFVGLLRPDGTVLDANQTALDFAGITLGDVTNRPLWDTPWWNLAPEVQLQLRKAIDEAAGGRTARLETTHLSPEGARRVMDVTIKPVFDRGGKVCLLVPEGRDISERKQAEALLVAERDRAQLYLDTVEAIIMSLDSKGKISMINRKGCQVLGRSREQLQGRSWFEECLPQPYGKELHSVFTLLLEGHLDRFEYGENDVLTAQGEIRRIAWHNSLLRDGQGRVSGTLSAGQDVTEQRRDQQQLQRSTQELVALNHQLTASNQQLEASNQQLRAANFELRHAYDTIKEQKARFEQLANSISEAFWLFDMREDAFVYSNQAWQELLGKTHEQFNSSKQSLLQLIVAQDMPRWDALVKQLPPRGNSSAQTELRIHPPHGQERWVSVSITVIADEQGEPIRAAGVLMDITEQKNAQEKERQHQRQLLQSEKMAGLGLLISGIAHEINNPNNFISLSTPLLRQAWKSAQPHICHSVNLQGDGTIDGMDLAEFFDNVSTMIDSIDEGSDKITHIVGELKDYVRHDTADFATLDVNRVITAAMKLAGPMAKKLVRTIQLDLSQNPLYIRGNLQRLEQVVINLVQNACDAAQGGRGVVVVSSRRRDTRIEIAVEDNGVGIAPEHLSIIFEPFFTTKQHLGGTGLGLAVSQSIVQDHGATLSVQSTPGQGTLFTVVFEAVDNDG